MKGKKLFSISIGFLLLISLFSTFAPLVTKYSFEEQNISERLESPSFHHWMGTDNLGRDLFSRILYGARFSLLSGVLATLIALLIGTITGTVAGYWGGWVDHVLMRIIDFFMIFPTLLMAILLMVLFGRGFTGILFALALTSWITQARLVRAQTLQIREMEYVEAAKALGLGPIKIIYKHILPNLWGPILVSLSIQIPTNIMSESMLSFIGLGLQPPYSSWGTLANEGFRAMKSFPHLIIFPGLVLFLTLLAFNYLGDELRDRYEVR